MNNRTLDNKIHIEVLGRSSHGNKPRLCVHSQFRHQLMPEQGKPADLRVISHIERLEETIDRLKGAALCHGSFEAIINGIGILVQGTIYVLDEEALKLVQPIIQSLCNTLNELKELVFSAKDLPRISLSLLCDLTMVPITIVPKVDVYA